MSNWKFCFTHMKACNTSQRNTLHWTYLDYLALFWRIRHSVIHISIKKKFWSVILISTLRSRHQYIFWLLFDYPGKCCNSSVVVCDWSNLLTQTELQQEATRLRSVRGKTNELATSGREKVGHIPPCLFLKEHSWVVESKMMHQEIWIIKPCQSAFF